MSPLPPLEDSICSSQCGQLSSREATAFEHILPADIILQMCVLMCWKNYFSVNVYCHTFKFSDTPQYRAIGYPSLYVPDSYISLKI